MSDDVAGLVERMALQIEDWDEEEPRENWWRWQRDFAQAADDLQSQAAEIARLRGALERIAAQKLERELNAEAKENASWIDGYEAVVREARAALAQQGGDDGQS